MNVFYDFFSSIFFKFNVFSSNSMYFLQIQCIFFKFNVFFKIKCILKYINLSICALGVLHQNAALANFYKKFWIQILKYSIWTLLKSSSWFYSFLEWFQHLLNDSSKEIKPIRKSSWKFGKLIFRNNPSE